MDRSCNAKLRKGTVPGIILVDYFFLFPYSLTDQWELSSEKQSAFYKPIQEIIKFIDFYLLVY